MIVVKTDPKALVVVADIVASRQLEAAPRRRLQTRIRELTGGGAGFRFAGGDEFEWRLPAAPESLDAFLLLRARLAAGEKDTPEARLRCGLGVGTVTVHSKKSPYEEDGPAYHRARAAYASLREDPHKKRRSRESPFEPTGASDRATAWDDGEASPLRDALIAHMDHLLDHWTSAQWQAIALTLEGARYEDVGRRLDITPQNVYKRLKSASFDLYLEGHAALKQGLRS